MKPLPPDIASECKALAVRGEKLKQSLRISSTWVLLTDKALYFGEPLDRFPRGEITGIEFDRAGSGPGTMLFMSGEEPLARIEFAGPDRPLLAGIEKALAPRRKRIQVFLEQSDYAPGETVRGHLEVEWPKASPVRGIRIGLVGAEETSISVSTGMGKDQFTTTYCEQDMQVAKEWILFGGDRIEWFQAAKEALTAIFSTQTYPLLPAGRHRFPFEFALPDDALPSYSGSYANVTYRLYAHVDVPLGFDRVFEGQLAVVGPREAKVLPKTYVQDQPSRGIFKNLSADLRMGLDIRRVPFQYGDLLKIRLRAENRGKKRIRCARCSLAAVEYAQAGGQDRQTRSELHYFTVRFPDPGAESQDYAMEVAIPAWPIPFSGRYSRVYFWFSAELDIARAFNASMEVPIEIE